MTTKSCAYLEMAEPDDWFENEKRWIPAFESNDWTVTAVRWRMETPDWNQFDAVFIGYPWDYPEYPQQFRQCLQDIARSDTVLVNDLALVDWTLDKRYLSAIESAGVPIVTTCWLDSVDVRAIKECFDAFATDEIIVKPVVGNNAGGVCRLAQSQLRPGANELNALPADQPVMVQPYLKGIESDGEYSLYFFGGSFSHAVQKIPAPGDFRVQEQFGADIKAAEPSSDLIAAAAAALRCARPEPVYARVDMIRTTGGEFQLMELELVEPSLYLDFDPDAPGRFASAFDKYVRKRSVEAA